MKKEKIIETLIDEGVLEMLLTDDKVIEAVADKVMESGALEEWELDDHRIYSVSDRKKSLRVGKNHKVELVVIGDSVIVEVYKRVEK